MTTIARAWQAFLQAIDEARELSAAGADIAPIADLLQHARELLEIIDEEFTGNYIVVPVDARAGLQQLRERLAAVENVLVTRH